MELGTSGWFLLGQVGMLGQAITSPQENHPTRLTQDIPAICEHRAPGAPGQEEERFPQPGKRPLPGRKWKGDCAPMSPSLDKTEGLLSYKVIKDQPPGFL